jgi:hypothetical protein
MIRLTSQFSGADVASALIDDPEELIFLLEELAEQQSRFDQDLIELIAGTTAEKVVAFLRDLANKIEERP